MKKSDNMPVWLSKMVLAQHFCHSLLRLVKGTANPNPAREDYSLLCARPSTLIGPGGLLLVVSHLYAVPVLVLKVGLEKSEKLNLDVKIFLQHHM
jgi:hypothetical protein